MYTICFLFILLLRIFTLLVITSYKYESLYYYTLNNTDSLTLLQILLNMISYFLDFHISEKYNFTIKIIKIFSNTIFILIYIFQFTSEKKDHMNITAVSVILCVINFSMYQLKFLNFTTRQIIYITYNLILLLKID